MLDALAAATISAQSSIIRVSIEVSAGVAVGPAVEAGAAIGKFVGKVIGFHWSGSTSWKLRK